MADYFRFSIPQPPFNFLIRRMFGDDDFVKDIERLANISESQRRLISGSLEEATFANKSLFLRAVQEAGVSEATEVAETLHRLSLMCRESDLPKDAAYDAFSKAVSSSQLSPSIHLDVIRAFKQLCLDPQSLDLQQKAERLAEATGWTIEDLEIVCDIRPVFNSDGDKIVGALPYFTLRIEYDDGSTKKLDLRLTSEDLDRLKRVVDRAVSKRITVSATLSTAPDWTTPEV